jgi:hypothetical protein
MNTPLARNTDPETSHEAAMDSQTKRWQRRALIEVYRAAGRPAYAAEQACLVGGVCTEADRGTSGHQRVYELRGEGVLEWVLDGTDKPITVKLRSGKPGRLLRMSPVAWKALYGDDAVVPE